MSDIKHTPGPWKRDHLTVMDDRKMVIAKVAEPHRMLKGAERNEDMEWCKGNARLITALPELIAFALAARAWLTDSNSPKSLRDLADAAIAKARGQS